LYSHVDLYIDESGDLGFSPSSSRHFVIVALASSEPNELRRMMRRVQRRRYPRIADPMEFKFGSSPERVRRLVCAGIARSETMIAWGAAIKSNIPASLRPDKKRFYLSICGRTLSELTRSIHARSIHVVLDKWSNSRSIRRSLDEVVEQTILDHHSGYFAPSITVSHLDSSSSEGIQIADFVAGAVFQSLERSNGTYLDLIAERVVSGCRYW